MNSKFFATKYRFFLLVLLLSLLSQPLLTANRCFAALITGGISRVVLDQTEITVEGGIIRSTADRFLSVHLLGLSGTIRLAKHKPGQPLAFYPQKEQELPAASISHADSYKRELLPGGAITPLPELEIFTIALYNVNPLRVSISGAKIIRTEQASTGDKKTDLPETKVLLQVEFNPAHQQEIRISSHYPNAESFQFVVMGNSQGRSKIYKKILRKIRRLRPLFWAHCGDLVHQGSGKEYQWTWALANQTQFPFFLATGDEDKKNKGNMIRENWYGSSYYSFNFRNAHFVFLDNASGSIDQQQFQWLLNDLSQQENKAIFVFLHLPPFDPRPNLSNNMYHLQNANWFMDIMSHYQVERVYTSHLTGYYRLEQDDVPYTITGGGGAKLLKKRDYYHFIVVTVAGDTVTDRVIKVR